MIVVEKELKYIVSNQNDPFSTEALRLHELTVYARWVLVIVLWLTIAPLSLWNLRAEIQLWLDHFTWIAVRYAIVSHRWATLGLSLCIGMTASTLVWQSRNILWGFPEKYWEQKLKQVRRIHQQGPSHPLWNWMTNSK
ncbi:MAG: hypothetical protein ACFBSC_22660 [Microcoleaceae cyanobacterium]